MTNQPDESHPMHDHVDNAMSWFSQTNEPETSAGRESDLERGDVGDSRATEADVRRTDDQGPLRDEGVARDDERGRVPEEGIATTDQRAPLAEEGTVRTDERDRAAEDVSPRTDERNPLAEEGIAKADERTAGEERAADETRVADERRVADHEAGRGHQNEPPASWAEVHPNARHVPPEGAIDSEAETTGSQRSLYRDEAPRGAGPAAAAAAGAAAGGAAAGATAAGATAAGTRGEQTAVMDAHEYARMRREERAARDRQLGKVIAPSDERDETVVTRHQLPSTYRGLPSFGFLIFRLIVAAVLGIRAWQHVTHLSATRATWAATVMPRPDLVAWVQIGLEIAIVVMLLLGLGTRIAGLLLLILSVVTLVFVQWGAVNPFQSGAVDFIGVVDVLLAGAGLLFATVGGGRVAFDGAIHSSRIQRKNDKLVA